MVRMPHGERDTEERRRRRIKAEKMERPRDGRTDGRTDRKRERRTMR